MDASGKLRQSPVPKAPCLGDYMRHSERSCYRARISPAPPGDKQLALIFLGIFRNCIQTSTVAVVELAAIAAITTRSPSRSTSNGCRRRRPRIRLKGKDFLRALVRRASRIWLPITYAIHQAIDFLHCCQRRRQRQRRRRPRVLCAATIASACLRASL